MSDTKPDEIPCNRDGTIKREWLIAQLFNNVTPFESIEEIEKKMAYTNKIYDRLRRHV